MQNKEIEFGISDIDKAYDFLDTIGFKGSVFLCE